MSGNGDVREMLQERRLQHQLELQSKQIETVLSKNEVDAQIEGGYVEPRSIRFDLTSHLEAGLDKLRFLKQDILNVLGVAEVEIGQINGRWHLNIKRPEEPPVSFMDMLPLLSKLEPLTAVLGLSDEGAPILFRLSDHEIPHIFISGEDNAGKSSLLRTIALSLAVSNKQHQLQLAVLDGSKSRLLGHERILDPLSYLPHMICSVSHEYDDQKDLLGFLINELAYRQEQSMISPRILVLIDEVVQIINELGNDAQEAISSLLQRGAGVGIHLILATKQPNSDSITQTMRLNLPLHLIGKTNGIEKGDSINHYDPYKSDYLLGKGDFLAKLDDEITHFQAAFVGDYDLHLMLETLHRNRPTPLLAHSFFLANTFVPNSKEEISIVTFNNSDNGIQIEKRSHKNND